MKNFENHPLHPGEGMPLFIAAGPIKEPGQLLPFLDIEDPLAAPVVTLGGFTLSRWPGNGEPDFTYDYARKAAGNSRGLPNDGLEAISELRFPIGTLNIIGIKTIIQVTNLPQESPLDVIPDLAEAAAENEPTAIEINLSCPNGMRPDGSFHEPLYKNVEASIEVVQAVRDRVGKELVLGVKDGPHVGSPIERIDPDSVKELAIGLGDSIDFVTGVNTIAGQDFPELTRTGGKGGMSGPILAPIAKNHLRLWRQFAPNVPYLSTGGVDSENAESEITERLELGAMLVGGAQEFYRARQPHLLAARWAIAAF